MRHWSSLLAAVAAIMLMIGGTPAFASKAICDPCPPDCPMMAQAEQSTVADHAGKSPQQDRKSKPPCEQTVLCQTAAIPPLVGLSVGLGPLEYQVAEQSIWIPPFATSRPPDRDLRPPIQL